MADPLRPFEGRVPPNDLVAEAALLSAGAMSDDALAVTISIVKPEHFYADANRRVFEALVALEASGTPRDLLTIRGWLADKGLLERVGGAKYLAEIIDATPSLAPDHVEEYAQRVVDKWRLRQVISTCQQYAAEGYGDIEDAPAFVDRAEQALFEIASVRAADQPQCLKTIVVEHYADIQARITQQAAARITTGLRSLDDQIIGLSAPNLVILAARPGMGKSSMLTKIARNVARSHGGAAIFSLEMSKAEMVDQMLCSDARVDSRAMARAGMGLPNQLTPEDWSRINVAAADLCKLPLWIDDEGGIGITALRAKCRRIAAECKARGTELRVVGVDYLQLMSGNPKATNREQQVSEISRNLKKLAKDLGVPVIALSQLSREIEKRGKKAAKPQLSDLRESGAIEQDADQVWFIWRDDCDGDQVAQVFVAKGRRFGAGDVRVKWTPQYTRFDDLAEKEYDELSRYRENF